MLSTKPIKNATQARFYFYENDNYYFKDSPQAQEHSQWYGRGAQKLGLSGPVAPEHFESLLAGQLPNGIQLGKWVEGQRVHRPGYDLTFSAPKSVSLLAFLGNDARLLEAHQKAVETALNYVERNCAQARVMRGETIQYENTGNLIFATFQQDLSRALDPQLHTHCVTVNATERLDGKWRALASSRKEIEAGAAVEGFWERVRSYQRYLGLIYRAQLAFEVHQLGYAIEKKDQEKGFWEIAGVHADDLRFFSKRREEIEKFMEDRGLEGARAAAYAAFFTRPSKEPVDRAELFSEQRAVAKTDFAALIEASMKQVGDEEPKNKEPEGSQKIPKTQERHALHEKDEINNRDTINKNEINKKEEIKEIEGMNRVSAREEIHPLSEILPIHKINATNKTNQVNEINEINQGNKINAINGISPLHKINPIHEPNSGSDSTLSPAFVCAQEAVDFAIEHLSSSQTLLRYLEILDIALQKTLGQGISVHRLQKAIDEAQQQKKLLPLGSKDDEVFFTTPQLVHYEQQTLQQLSLMKNTVKPLCDRSLVHTYLLQQEDLNTFQKACVKQLFKTCDQIVAVEGSRQSGTALLYKPIEQLAKLANHTVIVLTPTSQEARRLEQDLKLKRVDTVAGFIARTQVALEHFARYSGKGVIALIDHAQVLSTKELCALTTIAVKTGLRLMPVWDSKSTLSLGPGAPLPQMRRQGMTTFHLKEMLSVKIKKIKNDEKNKDARENNESTKNTKNAENAENNKNTHAENTKDTQNTSPIHGPHLLGSKEGEEEREEREKREKREKEAKEAPEEKEKKEEKEEKRGNTKNTKTRNNFGTGTSLKDFINATLPKIKDHIISISEEEKRFEKIAEHAVELYQARVDTRVLMQTPAQCARMNEQIHQRLKEQGVLRGESEWISVLIPRRFTSAHYRWVRAYQVGQWVRFNDTFRSLSVARGDYCRIKAIRTQDATLVLETPRGTTVVWDPQKVAGPSQKIEVFDEVRREFQVGEKIRALRNVKSKEIVHHDVFTLQEIHPQKLLLTHSRGKTLSLRRDVQEFWHWDYGYVESTQRPSSLKAETILTYQASTSRLSNQRQFYKLVSAATSSVFIYTDHRDRYQDRLQHNTGDKVPLIDTILSQGFGRDSVEGRVERALSYDVLNERLHTALTSLIARYSPILKEQKGASEGAKETQEEKAEKAKRMAEEAIHYALFACAEREAAFTHKEILQVALRHALGEVSPSLLEQAIQAEEKKGGLIRGTFVSDGTRWTTPTALRRERFILNWAHQGKGHYEPWSTPQNPIEPYLNQTALRESQKAAIRLMMTTTDRLVAIQGAPGTGKTTLLRAAADYLQTIPVQVQYLAPTHSAVNELNRAELKAITLQQWLADHRVSAKETQRSDRGEEQEKTEKTGKPEKLEEPRAPHSVKKLFILDEASFVSNAQAQEFFQGVEREGGRVVLVGDRKQNPAIEAGKPQTLLEWQGVPTAYLHDIQRQKDPTLLSAVKAAYHGAFADSFKLLDQRIIDDEDLNPGVRREAQKQKDRCERRELYEKAKALRIQAAVKAYFELDGGLLMTLSNSNRERLNNAIREQKIQRGDLAGEALNTTILEPVYLTEVERSCVMSFRVGQLLRFSSRRKTLGIEKGDYLPIVEIDALQNLCLLQNKQGQTVAFRPKKYREGAHSGLEVYAIEERELQVGDQIRWTRSNKRLGLIGGEIVTVLVIHPRDIELQSETGERRRLDIAKRDYQHWDYAYAVTVYSAQGQTRKKIVALAESYQLYLANQPNFIVMISRAVEQAVIITDDKEKLLQQIIKNTGEKWSALEVIGEIKPPITPKNPSFSSDETRRAPRVENPDHEKNEKNEKNEKREKTKAHSTGSPYWDAKMLTEQLANQVEFVLEKMLGKPKGKTGSQYRYGSHKGSLWVTVVGDRCGWWKDFQTDEGGRSLLSLIQRETHFNFKETLGYAAALLGLQESDKSSFVSPLSRSKDQKSSKTKESFDAHQKRMIQIARTIAAHSVSAKGTRAESYLREHRGITADLPATIYYHPAVYVKKYDESFPAMVIKLQNTAGKVQSVHLTLLDEKTANKANVTDPKLKFGPVPELINIPLNAQQQKNASSLSSLSLVAEGIETALSVKSVFPHADVKTALGKEGLKRVDPEQLSKDVVLCLDNDLKEWRDDKVITAAANRLVNAGKTVWMAMPETVNNQKTDFNDVLKQQGKEVIVDAIKNAVDYSATEKRRLNDVMEVEKFMQISESQEKSQEKAIRFVHQEINKINKINSAELLKENHLNKVIEEVSRLHHAKDDPNNPHKPLHRRSRHDDASEHLLRPVIRHKEISRSFNSLSDREQDI